MHSGGQGRNVAPAPSQKDHAAGSRDHWQARLPAATAWRHASQRAGRNQGLLSIVRNVSFSFSRGLGQIAAQWRYWEKKCAKPFWVLGFLAVYFSAFFVSGRAGPGTDLDPSWQMSLEQAAIHHWQFGPDIVFTCGPLGYLATTFSLGELQSQRMIFALIWSAVTAWAALGIARRLRGPLKVAFPIWLIIGTGFEVHVPMVMAYGGLLLLEGRRNSRLAGFALLPLFAFLGLVKFTFMLTALMVIAITSGVWLYRRKFMLAVCLPALFLLGLVIIWAGCGQHLTNLPAFFRASWEIASGYPAAMLRTFVDTDLTLGLTVAAAFLALFARLAFLARRNPASLGTLLIVLLSTFLAWRHGFVRADLYHIAFFTGFLPIACGLMLIAGTTSIISRGEYYFHGIACLLIAYYCFDPDQTGRENRESALDRAGLFFSVARGNGGRRFPQPTRLKADEDLSAFRARIGDQPVDTFPHQQGIVLLNHFHYQPRPVIQSYSAYTSCLQEQNLRFYQSEGHPRHVLMRLDTIDRRFIPLDDAPLLLFLLHNYRPMASTNQMLLLEQSRPETETIQYDLVYEGNLQFDKPLDLSRWNQQPLFMQMNVSPSLWGRLTAQLYQPATIRVEGRWEDGTIIRRRFIPALAQHPFLLSPWLDRTEDAVNLWSHSNSNEVRQIMFQTVSHQDNHFAPPIHVRLYHSPNFLKPAASR